MDRPEIMRPYVDQYLNLETNPYNNPNEPKTTVDEPALDRFINRIIINQAIAVAEGKEHCGDCESNPMGYDSSMCLLSNIIVLRLCSILMPDNTSSFKSRSKKVDRMNP